MNGNNYVTCYKVGQWQNTIVNLQPTFKSSKQQYIASLAQYMNRLDNVKINATLSQTVNSFSMFGVVTSNKIVNTQLIAQIPKATNLYGVCMSIAAQATTIENSIFNFTVNNQMSGIAFSLAQNIVSNVNMKNCQDLSSLKAQKVSMSQNVYGIFAISNCQFSQYFIGTVDAALITLIAKQQGRSGASISLIDSTIKATVSSNIDDNYGFVKTLESGATQNYQNNKGYVRGAYISLSSDTLADQQFTQYAIQITVNSSSNTLIDSDIELNNTKFSFGDVTVSAPGQNVSIFTADRPIYYGINIASSSLTVQASTLALITQTISGGKKLSKITIDIDVDAQTTKMAGLAFQVQQQLELTDCTIAGTFKNTGAIYLLFEETQQKLTITNLTTNGTIDFSADSYGLIKQVKAGIDIYTLNSNLSMNIIGDTLVDSSLMFYSVQGSSQLSGIQGYYGGYITSQICSSAICTISSQSISLDTKSIQGIQISQQSTSYLYNSTSYTIYQVEDAYFGKLNGTKVQFSTSYVSGTNVCVNVLGDSKLIKNTEVNASLTTSTTLTELYVGGIAGIPQKTGYDIENVTVNVTLKCGAANVTGAAGDFFGMLTTNITLKNVKSNGELRGLLIIGGIVGYLDNSSLTLNNATISGSYGSGTKQVGGVIGYVSQGSTTTVTSVTVANAKISSLSEGCGPIYGENQGAISQLNIVSISLDERSYYNDCPIGLGNTQEYSSCPAKSNNVELSVSAFPETTISYSTSQHKQITIRHVVPNSLDLNNTNVYLNMPDMDQPKENRSIFGLKASYQGLKLLMENEASMSWGNDQTGFAFLQYIIDDTTTSINDVQIQGTMYGRNYGHSSCFTMCFATNATVSNVTINVSSIYFYYANGFAEFMNATNPVLQNIKVNVSNSQNYGTYNGFIRYQYNIVKTSNYQNCQINTTTNGSTCFKTALIYQVYGYSYYYNNHTFTNCSITFNNANSSTMEQVFYNVNATNIYFYDCNFDVQTKAAQTAGSVMFNYNYVNGNTTFDNCDFTGTLNGPGTSSYNSYKVAVLEATANYGTKNINNCKVHDMTIIGQTVAAGLYAVISSSSVSVYIDNTSVGVALSVVNPPSAGAYIAGFIGNISNAYATVYISNSVFKNGNREQEVDCIISSKSVNTLTSSNYTNVQCTIELAEVNVNTDLTFGQYYYNSYSYSSLSHACYYADFDGTTDLNYTQINFQYSTYSAQCGKSGNTLITIFNPSFNPTTINYLTTTGVIRSQSYYNVGLALQHIASDDYIVQFSNVVLNHTFQEDGSVDWQFNQYGFLYNIGQNQVVQFTNCINEATHNHTKKSYTSYASGIAHLMSGTISLTDCVTNFTINDYSSYSYAKTTGYSVSANYAGNCTASNFTSSYSNQCI